MNVGRIARCAAALCMASCATASHDPVCAASRSLDGKCPGVFPQIGGDLLFMLAAPEGYSGRLADVPEDALRSSILEMLPHASGEAMSDLITRARRHAALDPAPEYFLPNCEHLPPGADPAALARIQDRGWLEALFFGEPPPSRRLLPLGLSADGRSAIVILAEVKSGGSCTTHWFSLGRPDASAEWQVVDHGETWSISCF